jgi:hypothetical protein
MGKYGGRLRGIDIGQIDDGIAAVLDRCDRPGYFILHGGFSALYKITGHDCQDDIAPGLFSCLLNMKGMSGMKRIVFRDDSANLHNLILSL